MGPYKWCQAKLGLDEGGPGPARLAGLHTAPAGPARPDSLFRASLTERGWFVGHSVHISKKKKKKGKKRKIYVLIFYFL